MNTQIISWINSTLGYDISAKYYEKIDLWLDWWRGYCKPFHQYKFNNGKTVTLRDMYTLKMGKKVCWDWASILLNSKTKITVEDEKANIFLQGEKETDGVLGANKFWVQANNLIEKAFATGTGAVVLHVQNVKTADGGIVVSPEAKIKLNYISAEMIIPISVDNGEIVEAAFCSESVVKGKKFINLETHLLDKNGNYIIHNYRFKAENGTLEAAELPPNMAAEYSTGCNVPWFAIIEPNIENDIECNNGLGVSVLHGAIDALKSVDLCFNNFCSDFYLGQKKVFMEKSLVEIDDDGTEIAPDDVHQQLFTYIKFPEDKDSDGKKFIQEFNPELRVEENTKGVQSALDYLSFKCGLGNKHYQFNGSTVVTATQYTGDKQDLIQNAHKHYIVVEEFMLSLVRAILHVGRHIMGADIDENSKVEIVFDKSVIIDEDAERLQDLQDVRDGIMAKWEYRVKWYGETEKEAKKNIAEIEDGRQVDLGFGDEA